MSHRLWDCDHVLNVSQEPWAPAGSWLWWQRSPPAPHLGCQTPAFPHPCLSNSHIFKQLAHLVLMVPHPSAQGQTLPWELRLTIHKITSLLRGKPLQDWSRARAGALHPCLCPPSPGSSSRNGNCWIFSHGLPGLGAGSESPPAEQAPAAV